jgi:hypothetical protein
MDTATKRGETTGRLDWLHASAPEGEAHQGEHLHYDRGSRSWRRHEDLVGAAVRDGSRTDAAGDDQRGAA